MRKKLFTLMTFALMSMGSAWAQTEWPDANFLLLDGKKSNKIDGTDGGSTSYTTQIGGTGATWTCNTSKYTYGNTTCTFFGNAFTKGLKHESATYTQVVTTGISTLTIVQSLNTNPNGTLDIETVGSDPSDKKDIKSFDADNLIVSTYEGENTVNGKTYKDVKVFKLCNLPAGTYKIYRGSSPTDQTYVVYMGVTYGTTAKVTIAATTSNGGESTVTGGGDYLVGATATMTATPGAGKAFTGWSTDGGSTIVSTDNPYSFTVSAAATYTAVFADAATKSISVSSNNDTYGTATATATTISEGSNTTLTATPTSEAYAFVNWTRNGSDAGSTNPLTVGFDDLSDGDAYVAVFKELYKMTYSKGEYEIGSQNKYLNGTQTIYASSADQLTTPTNYGIVKSKAEAANYTLKYWTKSDGTGPNITAGGAFSIYLGNAANFLDCVPVFVANTVSLNDLTAAQIVTWNFNTTSGAPAIHVENADGFYVTQTTINGETIDVPLYMSNSTGGKFYNVGRSDAQMNKGTYVIPAVKGMVARFTFTGAPSVEKYSSNDAEKTTIEKDEKDLVITYTGTNTSLAITFDEQRYATKLVVTYPKKDIPEPSEPVVEGETVTLTTTANMDGWRAFVDASQAYTVDANTTVYTVQASAEDNKVTLTAFDGGIPAGTPVILHTTDAGHSMTLMKAASVSATVPTPNILKATTTTTDLSAGVYRLGYKTANGVGFYNYASASAPAGVVYIDKSDVSTGSGVPGFVGFDVDGMATAIKGVKTQQTENDVFFNLAGQRVSQPTKGLYIVNGKKVIVK